MMFLSTPILQKISILEQFAQGAKNDKAKIYAFTRSERYFRMRNWEGC